MKTGIERLHFMIGSWDIEAFQMTSNGEWQPSPEPKETRIDSVFDGVFLREDEVRMMAGEQIIRFFIMWSYDQFRQTYRMVASDDSEGLMDILEGGFAEGSNTIVVSNLKTGTAVQSEEGKTVNLRLTSTKDSQDQFTDEMHESYDDGKSWLAVYRAIHTRQLAY